jgi:hypothetical protein
MDAAPNKSDNPLRTLLSFLLSPPVFISTLAPVLIGVAFMRIRGQLFDHTVSGTHSELAQMLSSTSQFACVDYAIQFYTLVLGAVFWFFAFAAHGKLVLASFDRRAGHLLTGESFALGLALGVYFTVSFIGARFGSVAILSDFATHTKAIGELQLPRLSNEITWARLGVILHSGLMVLAARKIPEPPITR